MMKRWIVWALMAALLLSGCTHPPVDKPTDPTVQTQPTGQLQESVPGLYLPESLTERRTHGAVRIYPLDGSCTGVAMMGEDVLVATLGSETAVLTRLTGLDGVPIAAAQLDCELYLDSSVCVTQKAVGFYHSVDNHIVLLNENLQETGRFTMANNMTGVPIFSTDMSEAYYCAGQEIRSMNLKSGITRMIRQSTNDQQSLVRTAFDNTVLECFVYTQDGGYTEFLSAATGQLLGKDESFLRLSAQGSSYYLERMDGSVLERLTGTLDGPVYSFEPESDVVEVFNLPGQGMLLSAEDTGNGTRLCLFDISSGKKTASVLLDQVMGVSFVTAATDVIWFSGFDATREQDVLYRWEYALSPVEDTQVYIGTRYTRQNPDTQALEALAQQAAALADTYGVQIHLQDIGQEPEEYTVVYEYQPKAIRQGLADLEKVLASLPEGFLKRLCQVSNTQKLEITLAREMYSVGGDAPADVVGLQHWSGGNAYITLSLGSTLEQAAYHELAHVLDTYVMNHSSDYDVWGWQNPEGFAYFENYTDYQAIESSPYLEGEQRAFIDAYSMSYAKEDRARFFEYAMMEGNEEYFESETMQAKLKVLCEGIRDGFRWKKSTETYPWEQYLKESLAYKDEK